MHLPPSNDVIYRGEQYLAGTVTAPVTFEVMTNCNWWRKPTDYPAVMHNV